MSVILVSTLPQGRIDRIAARSLACPGDLVAWPRQGVVAQDGRVAWVKGDSMLMILAVAARPRHIIPNIEMCELLWGDRPDGGPDRADQSLTAAWVMTKAALVALGWHAERRMGRGFSAWPAEVALYGEAVPVDIPRFLSSSDSAPAPMTLRQFEMNRDARLKQFRRQA